MAQLYNNWSITKTEFKKHTNFKTFYKGMVLRSHDKVEQQLDKLSKSCTPSKANATTFQGKTAVIMKFTDV